MSARLVAARIGIVAAGVVWGSYTALRSIEVSDVWLWGTDAAVVLAFALATAMALPSAPGTSILSALTALTWSIVVFAPFALYWHRGALVLLLLAAPRLWPRGCLARTVAVTVVLVSVTPYVWSADHAAITLALGLGICVVVLRPTRGPLMLAAAWLTTVLFAFGALWRFFVPDPALLVLRAGMYSLGLVVIGCLVAASAARNPAASLTDDVIRLSRSPASLRDRMAAAVSDQRLQVGWWDAARRAFVDASGDILPADPPPGSVRIPITVADREEAIILCSPAVAADRRMSQALVRATRLAAQAQQLDRELSQRVDQVAKSSGRLLLAADEERRVLRRVLDADVSEPLARLASDLARSSSRSGSGPLGRAAALFDRCVQQLQDLSLGLPPAELEDGLSAALAVLCASVPLPVTVEIDADLGDPTVATALYYACAEALSNVVKHARASSVHIGISAIGGRCEATIADDGCGGAIIRPRGGLAGIGDRMEALGGTIEVRSIEGRGTWIALSMPLATSTVETPSITATAQVPA